MTGTAHEILVICDKDLISSEASYHATCYKNFLKGLGEPGENDVENYEESISHQILFGPVELICKELNESPKIIEFKPIPKHDP